MSEERNHTFKSWLEAALYYRRLGLSPIPIIRNSKKAAVPWKKYQETPPSEEEIYEWNKKYSGGNLGLLTGKVSGLLVVDIDAGHAPWPPAGRELQSAFIVKTPGEGFHIYYRYIKGIRNSTSGLARGIDVRAEGGYVLAPPSIIDGKPYRIIKGSLEEALKTDSPEWLVKELLAVEKKRRRKRSGSAFSEEMIPEGQRNNTLFEMGCDMRRRNFKEHDIFKALKEKNEKQCVPQLPDDEVGHIFENSSKEPEKRFSRNKSITQAEELTRLIENEIIEYIRDQFKKPYILVQLNGHTELRPVSKDALDSWLARFYRERFHECPGAGTTSRTIRQIKARCDEEEIRVLHNRVAWDNKRIYYDLTCSDYRAIEISADGWQESALPPIFRRYQQQIPQVNPVRNGSIEKLWNFINVEPQDQHLFLTILASWYIPDIPHPILILPGQPGTGKTTITKLLKQLVDPSPVETIGTIRKEENLVLIFDHNWLVGFDNLDSIKPWLSDMICRAVTGDGQVVRRLYKDNDVVMRQYLRCFILNGIGSPATRDDLLDRSVIIRVGGIKHPRPIVTMMEEWKTVLPEILGCIFDAVSQAIKILPTIKENLPYRMADFTRWGMALAPGLGFTAEEFIAAYQASIDHKWIDSVETSPFASSLITLLDRRGKTWEGTASALARELEHYAQREGRQKALFSTHPRWIAGELMRIAPALENYGVIVERLPYKQIEGEIRRKVIRISRHEWGKDK